MSANFDTINVVSGSLNIGSGVSYDIILSDVSGSSTVFNQNNKNIDFAISGTNSFLYYDASTGRLGIGDKNPDAALHIIAPCANDGLKIEGTTNCPTGVRLLLLHNPGISPETGSFPSTIDLAGHNSNSETIYYAQIRSKILSPDSLSSSGEIIFNVDHTGTPTTVFRSNTSNTVLGGLNNASGSSYNVFGAKNNLSGMLYVNLGSYNSGSITSGLLLGNDIDVRGSKLICVSNTAGISGTNIVLFGNNTFVSGNNNIAVANDSTVSGINNILLGNQIILYRNTNNILGLFNNANISGVSGIGFGSDVNSTGNNNLFLGNSNSILGSDNSIIGSYIEITGSNNLLYGGDSSVSGSSIVSIGNSNNPIGVNSGLFVGNNIDLANSNKAVVMGLGNSIVNQLSDSVLIGISNDTSAGAASQLVMIGQNNTSSEVTNSLVLGNKNNLSGTVKNNIVIGPDNYSALTSNNNIVIGALNNNSGLVISSNGTVTGTSARAGGTINNSLIFGINNIGYNAVNDTIIGNKNQISGNNVNSIGSFNNIKGVNGVQNIGNSNFILGDNINVFGSKTTAIGSSSIVNNPAKRPVYSFGSGNILFGDNEIVVSGICIGDNNELLGPNNIVYGKNNKMGRARHPFTINEGVVVVVGDARSSYNDGENVLVLAMNPANTGNVFIRLIDEVVYDNVNGVTNITITESIVADGLSYGVQNTFDGTISQTSSISGWILPFQSGNDPADLILEPLLGNSNILIGNNNTYLNNSGIVLGQNTRINGVQNVVIGHNISGTYNNSVQIGTNNSNKVYIDDNSIIFNTGRIQNNVIFNSRSGLGTTFIADLASNRIGINNAAPRSTVDISGALTTSSLRVGLSGTTGYSLISDSLGNATWQFPVNLSGSNSGLLYKINDKVGSGISQLLFNNTSKHLVYLKPETAGGVDLEDAFTLTPSGLYINDAADDESVYNVYIRGSGIGLMDGQQDYNLRVNLFKTLPEKNAVQVYNITGVSGHFYRHTVTDSVFLPRTLTGTLLSVSSVDGLLSSPIMPRNTVLFSNRSSFASGNNDIKFFSSDKSFTIGTTGTLSEEQTTNFQGVNDNFSNIILCSTPNFGTVINNAGNRMPFSVIDHNRAAVTDRLGMHYWTSGGVLGLGVNPDTNSQATAGASSTRWYTHSNVKLFVNGKIKTNSLQITPQGSPPGSATERYLRADDDGNITMSAISLNTQFSGQWPTYVNASLTSRIDFGISTTARNSAINYTSAQNGLILSYDGSKWVNNSRGIRIYQPDSESTNDNTVPGLIFGPGGKKNSCNNSHVFAGTPFINNDSRYIGSNQMSKFYLKGRTIGNTDAELLSDFTKALSATASDNNAISIQYLYDPGSDPTEDWNGISVWSYKANFCGLVAPVNVSTSIEETNDFKGVAGTIQGAFLFRRTPSTNDRVITPLGAPVINYYNSSSISWSENPIYVTGIGTDNVQRLAVKTRGLSNHNILWNTTVDIQQLNHPSGITLGGLI